MPATAGGLAAGLSALFLVGSLLLAGVPYAGTAHAGLCIGVPNVQKSLEEADAVFSGEVIRGGLGDPDSDGAWGGFKFRVDRSWKGATGDSVEVYSQDPAYSSSGYLFEKGRTYLVYATRHGDGLRTDNCTRTTPVATADKDLEVLGPPTGRLTNTGGPPLLAAGALMALALLISAGSAIRRASSWGAGPWRPSDAPRTDRGL